jgi:hypothetical protein
LLTNVKTPPTTIDTRYIIGDGHHYVAVIPYIPHAEDTLNFLRIDSKNHVPVCTYTNWETLVDEHGVVYAISVTNEWVKLPPPTSDNTYTELLDTRGRCILKL